MTGPCPACGSPTARLSLPLERAALAVCGSCGHGVTVAGSRQVSADDYANAPAAREEFERQYLPARLRSYERGLELLGRADGRVLLDVGSNYGHFLALAARHGWRTVGVEPGTALRDHAVDGAVGQAVSSLEDASALGPFDAVTLWDVLEHLVSPDQALEQIAQLLVPGGRVLLRVPDARVFGALRSSPGWRALGQTYLTLCHPTNPEEHVTHFTPVSVSRLAGRAGLRERAWLEAHYDERVFAAKTPLDAGLRRALHRAGRRLPYEFTMMLERTGAPNSTRAAEAQAPSEPAPPVHTRVAYIVSRFPVATETFLLREFDRVDQDPGVAVELFSLFRGERGSVHRTGDRWLGRVHRGRPLDSLRGLVWWSVRRPARLLSTAAWVARTHAARPAVLVRALVTLVIAAGHARSVAALRIHHVHACWATYPALAAWVCWRLTGIPYSFTGHAHDLFIHQIGLERKLQDARFTITISEHNQAFLSKLGGHRERVHIVHCGVDLTAYRFRARGPSSSGTVHALCVASFSEFKGHRVLIEALAAGGPEIDRVQVELIGEGPLRGQIENLARRRGVRHRLQFRGRLSEQRVAERLDVADFAVLPSIVARDGDTEGIPNALIEALASGVPVVSTRVSGIPELVHDGVTGLLTDPEDVEGLRRAIERTLADPEAAQARAEAGRRLVEREFDIELAGRRLVELFTSGDG